MQLLMVVLNRMSYVLSRYGEFILVPCYFRSIRLSGKFVKLISKRISETFGFCHSVENGFLLRYTNFGPIRSFSS